MPTTPRPPRQPLSRPLAAQKAALRDYARGVRRATRPARRRAAAASIRERVHRLVHTSPGVHRVGLYAATPFELGMDELVAPLRAEGLTIAYPRVVDATTMAFHEVTAPPITSRGQPPIREPDSDSPIAATLDLIVVPGLAFDAEGRRLGHGGGHYDRWLAAHPGTLSVGVCTENLLLPAIPTGAQDVRVAAVVTESAVYR